jgi:uncharacterized protein YecT (DUF1311 family)
MKRTLKLLAFATCLNLAVGATEDPRLTALEVALDDAMTQTAMNMASFEVSEYLKAELEKTEGQVRAYLHDDQSRALFDAAASAWINYRTAQVKFAGNSYAGGSMQPLMINLASARLTRERLNAIKEILDDYDRLFGP